MAVESREKEMNRPELFEMDLEDLTFTWSVPELDNSLGQNDLPSIVVVGVEMLLTSDCGHPSLGIDGQV